MDRVEGTAQMITRGSCTLGDARSCVMSGDSVVCRKCGWRAGEIERRKRLPMFRNDKGLWEKKVGVKTP